METTARGRPFGAQGHDFQVVVLGAWSELPPHVSDWDDLAASALDPNPFYESWMLLPDVERFQTGREARIVLVFAPHSPGTLGPRTLCGLFPLELRRWYKGLPITHYASWAPRFPLGTPLVRADRARECLRAFLDWLANNPDGCSLMEFGSVAGEGAFHQVLVDCLNEGARLSFVSDCYTRALFRPRPDAESYLREALRGVHLKELRRQQRRLAETGSLEAVALGPDAEIERWIHEFLEVEGSGWKGREGTALGAGEATRQFFVTAAREAFKRGRLMMLALRLDGRAIAVKVSVLAGGGAFALKIGYDERYARFSPGVLLEVENVRRLHGRPDVAWMDSCAVAEHFMINRLWLDRRTIQTVLIPTGKRGGDVVVSLLPLVRWLNRRRLGIVRRVTARARAAPTG